MRRCVLILAIISLNLCAWSQEATSGPEKPPCAAGGGCLASKKDLKKAKRAYEEGLKLQKSNVLDEAFDKFQLATEWAPLRLDYVRAREFAREAMVSQHVRVGNAELEKQHEQEAAAEFRAALSLDPENAFARQRLQDASRSLAVQAAPLPIDLSDGGEVRVIPTTDPHDFHFRGDSRQLLAQVAQNYGVSAVLDDTVASRRVHFDIQNVDFMTAMTAAGAVTKTFWVPTGSRNILVASDTQENHRLYDPMVLRTFYVPGVNTPSDLNDVVNLLRNLFEIRFLTAEPQSNTIVVRAPQNVMDAAAQFMQSLNDSRPEVLLDINVYEVSHNFTRNIGLNIPTQFNLYNIPAAALAALGNLNASSIAGLLSQLQNQQSGPFSQPLATFGGGLTLEGLSLGTLQAQLSLNESWVKTLERATLRVSQGTDGNFHMGSRYPIVTSSYSGGADTSGLSQLAQQNSTVASLIQNNSIATPAPSISYEDLGLTIKAKPAIDGNSTVNLQLTLQFRTLGGTSVNSLPVISNREYQGTISLANGEPAVVAGELSRTDIRSLSGLPGLTAVPLLNQVDANRTKEIDADELLIMITPHIVSHRGDSATPMVWLKR